MALHRNLERLAWTVGAAGAAGFVAGVVTDNWSLRMVSKPFPVLAMLAVAGARARTPYGRAVTAGLALCLVGDILLETGPDLFTAGLVAFLLGHLVYIYAYTREARSLQLASAVPFALWCGGLLAWIWPSLGGMKGPVAAYAIVICSMMWRALAAVAETREPWARQALAGAVLFAVSDSLIAVSKFHVDVPYVRYPIIGLYWAGQVGITASAITLSERMAADATS